jgi:hypothetical protein
MIPKEWNFPKNAKTFRILIDSPHGERIVESEWKSIWSFNRMVCDFAPIIEKSGCKVGFIACSSEAPRNRNYGDVKQYWHWNGKIWHAP